MAVARRQASNARGYLRGHSLLCDHSIVGLEFFQRPAGIAHRVKSSCSVFLSLQCQLLVGKSHGIPDSKVSKSVRIVGLNFKGDSDIVSGVLRFVRKSHLLFHQSLHVGSGSLHLVAVQASHKILQTQF